MTGSIRATMICLLVVFVLARFTYTPEVKAVEMIKIASTGPGRQHPAA